MKFLALIDFSDHITQIFSKRFVITLRSEIIQKYIYENVIMNASILVINQLNINNLLDQTGLPDQYSVSKKRHRRSRITTHHHQGFPTPTCNWLQHCQPQQYLRLSPSPLWCFQTSPLRCLDLSTPYSQSRKEMLYGDTGSLEGMLIRTPCGEGEGHPEEKATSSRAGHPTLSVAT